MHGYKQKHATNKNPSIKWALTPTVSRKNVWARDEEKWAHGSAEVLSVQMRHHVFPPPPPLSLSSLAAPGLCLCDANCFCYSCQVPTLPQHILQTGPWSLSCFLCLFKEWKNVCCHLRRAHHCSSSRPWLSECHNDTHSHTLSEVEGGGGWNKTMAGEKQENNTDTYNC